RALGGLIPQAIPARITGEVWVNGLDVRHEPLAAVAQHIGLVFQDPSVQLFHLRVEDDVAFGPRNLGLPEAVVQQRVTAALQAVGAEALRRQNPAELSGGQKQRVAIAAALAMQPAVLVLDEPTASLDVKGTRLLTATLERLRQQTNVTIILVEHRLADVLPLTDRLIMMDEGRIVADDAPQAVLADRQRWRALGLRRPAEQKPTPWTDLIQANGHTPHNQAPLLRLQNVTAGYNGQAILTDLNLTLYPGEFAALVGDNGAGKSTLALLLAGLLKPTRGSVQYRDGQRPRPGRDVSLLFQNPADQLFTDSVEEEVAFGPRNYRTFEPTFQEETLRQTGLAALRRRQPLALSMGQQQRVAVAACLALRPHLLILDEPTLGQDWGHLQRLMDFLLTLNQAGTAVLLITHDYKLIHHYAHRVLIMANGRIGIDGRLPAKTADQAHIETNLKEKP
ncbi:MAG: ABC transporter ATP-binding protein, partial [Chloroflexota bacterium]